MRAFIIVMNIAGKTIHTHRISRTENGFLSITVENFLAKLTHEIPSEIEEIKNYCSCKRNLLRTYALTALIKDGRSQSLPSEKLLMKSQIASLSASFLTR